VKQEEGGGRGESSMVLHGRAADRVRVAVTNLAKTRTRAICGCASLNSSVTTPPVGVAGLADPRAAWNARTVLAVPSLALGPIL